MTNLLAYQTINDSSTDLATLMLSNRGLDATSEAENVLASAFAYLDKADGLSVSQGKTSITIDESTRNSWIRKAKQLAESVGVELAIDDGSEITSIEW